MQKRRSLSGAGQLSLLLLLALILGALPGPVPAARAQGTTPTPPAPETPSTPATPLLSLPSGEVAAIQIVERRPEAGPKTGGLTQATAAALNFGPAGATLQQQSLSNACAPMITNVSFFGNKDPDGDIDIYDWTVYRQSIYYRQDFYYSPPFALSFRDGDDAGDSLNGKRNSRDEDWFGQDFIFPTDGRGALIEYSVRYSGPSQATAFGLDRRDLGYVELYLVDGAGSLIDEDPGTNVMDPVLWVRLDPRLPNEDGYDPAVDAVSLDTWYRWRVFVNASQAAKMQGKRVAFVFDQDGDRTSPYEEATIDNAQVTVCPTAAEPAYNLDGYVTRGGVPAEGQTSVGIATATMALFYSPDGVSTELVRTTYPDTNGYYHFSALPALPAGGYYQVWYLKSATEDDPSSAADDRLAYYAGPRITQDRFSPRSNRQFADGGNFEIMDIGLQSPAHYAEVSANVTYSWTAAPIEGARYQLCFADPDTEAEHCEKLTAATSLTVSTDALKAGWPSLVYGKSFSWYVRVVGPGYSAAAPVFEDIGASGYSNSIKFLKQAVEAPPAPEPGEAPNINGGQKRWTLMFYMAGDDEELSDPPGYARSMQDMVPALIGLSDTYPDVNIVAQFDFYETNESPVAESLRGTQRCFFEPGVRNLGRICQQLGEQSMADEAVLAEFIDTALTIYPANHTALIILGHGHPVAGVAGDRTGADDAMDPTELDAALASAIAERGRPKLDALVFYNCLMGSYEVATMAADYAQYMVGSPNIATLIDINREMVALAYANPTDGRGFAAGIVEAYHSAVSDYNDLYRNNISATMAAYDLSKLGAIKPLVDNLAQALIDNLSLVEVGDARDSVQQYDSSAPVLWGFNPGREDALVDLGNLAAKLATSPNSAVSAAATALLGALGTPGDGRLVLHSFASSGLADTRAGGVHSFAPGAATGLSIYFPNGSAQGNQSAMTRYYLLYYRQLGLGAGTWDELVDATRTGLPTTPRSIRLAALAGQPGTTLQNLGAPELFPAAARMPGGSILFLPAANR